MTAIKVAAVAASLTVLAAAALIGGLALLATAHERMITEAAGDE